MHVRVSSTAFLFVQSVARQQSTQRYKQVQLMFVAVETWW
jgi:hypothetical protein